MADDDERTETDPRVNRPDGTPPPPPPPGLATPEIQAEIAALGNDATLGDGPAPALAARQRTGGGGAELPIPGQRPTAAARAQQPRRDRDRADRRPVAAGGNASQDARNDGRGAPQPNAGGGGAPPFFPPPPPIPPADAANLSSVVRPPAKTLTELVYGGGSWFQITYHKVPTSDGDIWEAEALALMRAPTTTPSITHSQLVDMSVDYLMAGELVSKALLLGPIVLAKYRADQDYGGFISPSHDASQEELIHLARRTELGPDKAFDLYASEDGKQFLRALKKQRDDRIQHLQSKSAAAAAASSGLPGSASPATGGSGTRSRPGGPTGSASAGAAGGNSSFGHPTNEQDTMCKEWLKEESDAQAGALHTPSAMAPGFSMRGAFTSPAHITGHHFIRHGDDAFDTAHYDPSGGSKLIGGKYIPSKTLSFDLKKFLELCYARKGKFEIVMGSARAFEFYDKLREYLQDCLVSCNLVDLVPLFGNTQQAASRAQHSDLIQHFGNAYVYRYYSHFLYTCISTLLRPKSEGGKFITVYEAEAKVWCVGAFKGGIMAWRKSAYKISGKRMDFGNELLSQWLATRLSTSTIEAWEIAVNNFREQVQQLTEMGHVITLYFQVTTFRFGLDVNEEDATVVGAVDKLDAAVLETVDSSRTKFGEIDPNAPEFQIILDEGTANIGDAISNRDRRRNRTANGKARKTGATTPTSAHARFIDGADEDPGVGGDKAPVAENEGANAYINSGGTRSNPEANILANRGGGNMGNRAVKVPTDFDLNVPIGGSSGEARLSNEEFATMMLTASSPGKVCFAEVMQPGSCKRLHCFFSHDQNDIRAFKAQNGPLTEEQANAGRRAQAKVVQQMLSEALAAEASVPANELATAADSKFAELLRQVDGPHSDGRILADSDSEEDNDLVDVLSKPELGQAHQVGEIISEAAAWNLSDVAGASTVIETKAPPGTVAVAHSSLANPHSQRFCSDNISYSYSSQGLAQTDWRIGIISSRIRSASVSELVPRLRYGLDDVDEDIPRLTVEPSGAAENAKSPCCPGCNQYRFAMSGPESFLFKIPKNENKFEHTIRVCSTLSRTAAQPGSSAVSPLSGLEYMDLSALCRVSRTCRTVVSDFAEIHGIKLPRELELATRLDIMREFVLDQIRFKDKPNDCEAESEEYGDRFPLYRCRRACCFPFPDAPSMWPGALREYKALENWRNSNWTGPYPELICSYPCVIVEQIFSYHGSERDDNPADRLGLIMGSIGYGTSRTRRVERYEMTLHHGRTSDTSVVCVANIEVATPFYYIDYGVGFDAYESIFLPPSEDCPACLSLPSPCYGWQISQQVKDATISLLKDSFMVGRTPRGYNFRSSPHPLYHEHRAAINAAEAEIDVPDEHASFIKDGRAYPRPLTPQHVVHEGQMYPHLDTPEWQPPQQHFQ